MTAKTHNGFILEFASLLPSLDSILRPKADNICALASEKEQP